MDATHLASIVGLLIALSIASERLVEIIKGVIPALNIKREGPKKPFDGRHCKPLGTPWPRSRPTRS